MLQHFKHLTVGTYWLIMVVHLELCPAIRCVLCDETRSATVIVILNHEMSTAASFYEVLVYI